MKLVINNSCGLEPQLFATIADFTALESFVTRTLALHKLHNNLAHKRESYITRGFNFYLYTFESSSDCFRVGYKAFKISTIVDIFIWLIVRNNAKLNGEISGEMVI